MCGYIGFFFAQKWPFLEKEKVLSASDLTNKEVIISSVAQYFRHNKYVNKKQSANHANHSID